MIFHSVCGYCFLLSINPSTTCNFSCDYSITDGQDEAKPKKKKASSSKKHKWTPQDGKVLKEMFWNHCRIQGKLPSEKVIRKMVRKNPDTKHILDQVTLSSLKNKLIRLLDLEKRKWIWPYFASRVSGSNFCCNMQFNPSSPTKVRRSLPESTYFSSQYFSPGNPIVFS